MKPLFSSNIGKTNRLARSLGALALLVGAGFGFCVAVWLVAVVAGLGGFVLFEALRGWCVMRACGIRTRH